MSEYIDIIYVVIVGVIIWIWLTHRQYVKDEKELELKRKQDMCHHEYIEVESGIPLDKTQDYLFAYRYLDKDPKHYYYYISSNDLQRRKLPDFAELNKDRKAVRCSKCSKETVLSYADIIQIAIYNKHASGDFWFLTRNSRTKGDYIQRSRNNLPKL